MVRLGIMMKLGRTTKHSSTREYVEECKDDLEASIVGLTNTDLGDSF